LKLSPIAPISSAFFRDIRSLPIQWRPWQPEGPVPLQKLAAKGVDEVYRTRLRQEIDAAIDGSFFWGSKNFAANFSTLQIVPRFFESEVVLVVE
jgi:hypothetical protein